MTTRDEEEEEESRPLFPAISLNPFSSFSPRKDDM